MYKRLELHNHTTESDSSLSCKELLEIMEADRADAFAITDHNTISGHSIIKKLLDNAVADLTAISGQKPLITKARKSVAGFKIRQGYPIGCKVTLRGERMWEFFERLISIAVPRIRDFRGLNAKSFDGRGNYSMGVREQIIFPEIDYDKVDRVRGLDITITTTAKNDEEGQALLAAFNFPFRK